MTDTQKLLNFICEMHYAINTAAIPGREFDLVQYFNSMLKHYEIDELYMRYEVDKVANKMRPKLVVNNEVNE